IDQDSSGREFAKHAARLTVRIRSGDPSEVGVVTIPLHRVATVAESLQVRRVVTPAAIPGNDVVYFECLQIRRNPAQLAPELRPLKNLVSDRARDVPG